MAVGELAGLHGGAAGQPNLLKRGHGSRADAAPVDRCALHRQGDALSTINHIKESGTDLGLVSLEQPASAGAWWRALGRQSAPRIMALAPFIRIAGRPAGHPALVISPELADPTPPDLSVYAVTTLGADPAREIASAGGSVLAASGRERLIVLPAGASAEAIAARAGLDDIARVGGLFRGMAIGEESADAALYQRIDQAGASR